MIRPEPSFCLTIERIIEDKSMDEAAFSKLNFVPSCLCVRYFQ